MNRIFLLLIFSLSWLFGKLYNELPQKRIDYFYIKGHSKGPKIVIVGGIHGNETGGFTTAEYLKNLKIDKGEILVIPRANPIGIMANVRGYNGDMNKKFDNKNPKDKDYRFVVEIERLILRFKPKLLLSLHDGYGFVIRNKNAWGQAIIIDENRYGDFNLRKIAKFVKKESNKHLRYKIDIKNTYTFTKKGAYNKNGLTGWSLKNGILAFALEASKNISLKERIKTHLEMINNFLRYYKINSNVNELKKDIKIKYPKVKVKLLINNKYVEVSKKTTLVLKPATKIKVLNLPDGVYLKPRGIDLNWRSFYFKNVIFDVMYGNKRLFTFQIKEKN